MIHPALFLFLLNQLPCLTGTSCPRTSSPSPGLTGQPSCNHSAPQHPQCLTLSSTNPQVTSPGDALTGSSLGGSALLPLPHVALPKSSSLSSNSASRRDGPAPLPGEVQPSARNLLIPPVSESTCLHLHTLGWGTRGNAPLPPSGHVLPWVLSPATPIPQ